MHRKIKIIHLMDQAVYGGAEIGIIRRIQKLNKKKYEISVCFLYADNPYLHAFQEIGISVYSINMSSNKEITGLIRLFNFLRKNKPHILHTHFTNSNLYGVIIGKILRIPVIISTFHMMRDWHKTRRLRDKLRYILSKPTFKLFDRIVTVSEAVKKSAIEIDGINKNKVKAVFNGIDTTKYIPLYGLQLRKNYNIDVHAQVIGTVGRLCFEKGQQYLINAMCNIKLEFPNSKLIIIGEGEFRPFLESLIKDLNLVESVMLMGYREDIPELLSLMDVFVLPSLTEGMPNSLLEAMACALPCIVSNIPSCAELIDNNVNGLLIEPKNAQDIQQKVRYMLRNQQHARSMGSAAREKIITNFDVEKIGQNLNLIYDEILSFKISL